MYESSECVVELLMGHKLDLEYHKYMQSTESNYMCFLHWYGSDGTHRKIDLRKIVRRERKKVHTSVASRRSTVIGSGCGDGCVLLLYLLWLIFRSALVS